MKFSHLLSSVLGVCTFTAASAFAQVTVVTTSPSGSIPETITPIPASFGVHAGDYFVPDVQASTLYVLPAAGGSLTPFATGVSGNGGVFLPAGYGALSGDFL